MLPTTFLILRPKRDQKSLLSFRLSGKDTQFTRGEIASMVLERSMCLDCVSREDAAGTASSDLSSF